MNTTDDVGVSWKIPYEARKFGEIYFSREYVEEAQKLLARYKLSISFTKGSLDNYFICSGIVEDDFKYEAKVVFRKRLENSLEGPINSSCDCHRWTKEDHCPHTCVLFLHFYLSLLFDYDSDRDVQATPNSIIPFNSMQSISITQHGTIIELPQLLQGVQGNSTYSSMQYILNNKKAVNFPIPDKLDGHLVLDFTTIGGELDEMAFKYVNADGDQVDEISIFENLYMFNWVNGKAYYLPRNLKYFIQKIRIRGGSLSINDALLMVPDLELDGFCKLSIDGNPIEEIPHLRTQCLVHLGKGVRRGQIQLDVVFHDENDVQVAVPELINSFTFVGGALDSFRNKNNAYDFIEDFISSYDEDNDSYKKGLFSSADKERWSYIINYCRNNDFVLCYDANQRAILDYDCDLMFKVISAIYTNFGKGAFRASECNRDLMMTSYQLLNIALFDGMSGFYDMTLKAGVKIYYDKTEVQRWQSKIRFERKSSSVEWFDLELSISDQDMQLINKADVGSGVVMMKHGMVLLNKEQRDLVRFIKRYTSLENEAHFREDSDDDSKGLNKFILPFKKARIFELFELRKLGIEGALTQEEIDLCYKLETMTKMPAYRLPDGFEDVLRPYQKTGYNWLRFLYENRLGACLADDMGLGKTIQAISFIKGIYDKIDKVLIVCPVTILLNWEKEFTKFSDINIHIYHGGGRSYSDEHKVVLTSYGVMKKEASTTFQDINFDVLILDEVQHLKNIRSLGAYAARKIKADFRITLTGTPVENDLAEFYNILDLSIPGIWGDISLIRTASTKKSRLFARRTAGPFILRRTKGQVLLELPPKVENNVFLKFSPDEESAYRQSLIKIRDSIKSSPSKRRYGEILRGLLELRQKCLWQSASKLPLSKPNAVASTKIDFLIETLEQIIDEGHQAIIFSQFTTYLDIIQHFLAAKHWKIARIDGSQTVDKRQSQVDLFQEGKCPIFLISLKAGGVGLNLTAASYVFVMDPWWNPAVEQQAIGRAHRIGQKNAITVYRPIIKSSVEEKVMELQKVKKELFCDLLPEGDDSLFTGKLSMVDFESLFT